MNIFILNRNEEIVQVLSDSAEKTACHFFNSTLVVELNKGSNFTFEVDALNGELLEHIKEENFVVVPYGSEYKLFIIREIVDIHSDSLIKEVYCEDASIELADEIILESFTDKVEIVDALKSMLKDTRWTSGIVDDTYIRQLTEEYKSRSVLDAIYTLASEYNVEVDFSVEFTGNTITGRKVNIKKAFGRTLGKRFESSKDITSLKRTIQTGDIKTAIIPYGKTNEETGEVLTIKNVVWEASQNPMDKPVGQIFLEDKEATEVWGYTGVNGKKRPRWFAVHFDEVEDENELIKLAHLQLKRMTTPKVSYEVEALDLFRLLGHEEASHEEVKLGDLVNIVDHEFTPALTLTSRVVKIEHDLNNPANTKFTLGNIVESIVDKDLKTQLQELNYKVGAIQNKVDLSDIENRLDNIETNISSGRFEDINELNNLLFGQGLGYHYIEGENGLWIYDRPKDQRPTKVVAIKGGMIGLGQWDSQLQKWKIGTFIDGTNVNASMITTGTLSADRIEAGTLDINKLNVALRSKIAEIDGKASTGYVDTKISTAVDSINLSVSSKYATKSETESLKTSAVTESKKYSDTKKAEAISEAVQSSKSYADTKKAEAITQAGKDADSKVATAKTELNGKIDSKANKTDVYTKTQTYTKSETDSAIKVAKDSIELGVSQKYETKNNVTTKINSAKTEAINSAVSTSKSYADAKKTEAITQAGKDADSKVNSAKTELNNKIDLKASKTDVYTKSETYTKTETDSKIKVAKDEINLSVSNNYETKTNVENKISTAVSKIQIGGRNLAYKETIKPFSSSTLVLAEYVKNGKLILTRPTGNGDGGFYFDKLIKYKENSEYIVHFCMTCTKGTVENIHFHNGQKLNSTRIYIDDIYVGNIGNVINTSVFDDGLSHKVRMEYTTPSTLVDSSKGVNQTYFQPNKTLTNNTYTVIIEEFMVEEGTKITSWSPAPEDVQASIDLKAEKTDVYSKSEVYTKSQTDSAINVAKDSINLGVSQTYETKSNVETKISSANTTTLNSAKSYADTKKQEAISTASTDATNKVNSAKNELNTAISKKANTTDVYKKSETYTKAETDSAIKVAKDEINLGVKNTYETKTNVENKISNVTNTLTGKIDGIQIGGRNLVKNSPTLNNTFAQLNTFKGTKTILDDNSAKSGKSIKIECTTAGTGFYFTVWSGDDSCVGKKFTWSFYAKMNSNKTLSNIGHERGGRTSISATTEWKRFEYTWTYSSTGNRAFIFYPNFVVGDILYIKDFKIEEGTKATDWTPAPEDIDSVIGTKANKTDVYAKSEVYTKAQTDSAIKVAKDEINLGVKNTYETKTNVESKITTAVNNVQVGGDNVLRNGNFVNELNNWSVHDVLTTAGTSKSVTVENGDNVWKPSNKKVLVIRGTNTVGRYGVIGSTMKLVPNTKYTISGYCAGHRVGNIQVNVRDVNASHANIFTQNITPATGGATLDKWHRFELTFTTTSRTDFALNLYSVNFSENGYVWFCDVQIQQGTKATAWTPCSADTDDSIDSKASKTDVYKKSETYTKAETDSAIKVAKDSINLSVSNTYETKTNVTNKINSAKTEAINSANSSTDTKLKNYSTTAQMNSAIQVAKDSITNTVSSTYTKKADVESTYATKSSLTQTANNITASFKATGGYNLIANSTGYNGTNLWSSTGATMGTAINNKIGGATNKYMFLDNGTKTTESFAFSKRFKLKANTKYTLSGWFHNFTKCPNFDVFLLSSTTVAEDVTDTSYTNTQLLINAQNTSGSWKKFSITFTTPANVISGYLRIDNNGYNSSGTNNNRVHWSALMLNEGEEQPWSPHPDEVYNGSTIIDASGITINNGALTVKNNSGTTVLSGDSNGNLDITGTVKSQKGNMYVSLDYGGLTFQSAHNKEQLLRMETTAFTSNKDINGVDLNLAKQGEYISFNHINKENLNNGWSSSDGRYNFVDFWSKDTTLGSKTYKKGINVNSPMYVNKGLKLYSGTSFYADIDGSISWNNGTGTVSNLLGLYGDNGAILGYKSGESLSARFLVSEASQPGTGDNIISWGNYNFNGYTFHNANIVAKSLSVQGSKNCLQETKSYGARLINAYETAEYYFGDIGFGQINEEGVCYIDIDDVFLECVNTDAQYHVFTQIYNGKITSIERYKTYFIVKGEPNTEFSWELKAKRKGYENNRLDTQLIDIDTVDSGLELFTDSDLNAITSENILTNVLDFNLENILLMEE